MFSGFTQNTDADYEQHQLYIFTHLTHTVLRVLVVNSIIQSPKSTMGQFQEFHHP